MIMIEELLQSTVANQSFRLPLVLADKNRTIRIDTTAMPNGIVYSHVDKVQ